MRDIQERTESARARFDKAAAKIKKQIGSSSDIHSKQFRSDVNAYLKKNPDETEQSDWRKLLVFLDMNDEGLSSNISLAENLLDNSIDIDISGAKKKAEQYTDLLYGVHKLSLNDCFDMADGIESYKPSDTFGSKEWEAALEKKHEQGMSDKLYQEIRKFSDEWIETIGIGDLADEKRLAMSERWIKKADRLNKSLGDKNPLLNVTSYWNELSKERRNGLLSKKEYDVLWNMFEDAYMYEFEQSPAGMERKKELEQKAKSMSVGIWLLIQIAVPALFCIGCNFIIGGIAIWGLCGPVIVPLQLIGGAFLATAIAKHIVFGDEEPGEKYKEETSAALGGVIIGGIHAGIGCANELRKPGWIKDSK